MTAQIETTSGDDGGPPRAPTPEADAACDRIIWNHVAYAAVAGLVPIPAVDIAAATTVQVRMVAQLCEARGVKFSEQAVKTVISTLITVGLPRGVLGYPAISAAKSVPGIGTLLAVATLPALNGAVTWAVGRVFDWHFARGGTIETLNPAALSSRFATEVERGKSAVKSAVRRRDTSKADDAEVVKTEAG
ncbi:YcjF family protein [Albimonas pacifica]|uniref:Uncharacterized conserved protein, DUF697 family n=1 Tax=Albimonas pacifica TaxID=1114924 RepID=A0A1I3BFF5_9RHOB|nr:DUF697 domain-containing protein [Albimonas pacifica]SFH60461.1 Uncharacterized conserved protein, DUF697 family [Albimonas pacifica]